MWGPVSRNRRAAAGLPDLRGRAAICELEGPGVADARGTGETSQARLAQRSRHPRHRRRAGFCDRATRAVGPRGRWLRDVGLCAAGHPRSHRLCPLARWPEGDRRLAPALSMAQSPTGARRSAAYRSICMATIAPSSRGRTPPSCHGPATAIGSRTISFWCEPADISPAAR